MVSMLQKLSTSWKKSKTLWTAKIMAGLVIISSAPTLVAHADDTEDLLNIYGMTLGGPNKAVVESRMKSLEKQINDIIESANAIQKQYDRDNAAIEQYNKKKEQMLDGILNDIGAYQNQNDMVVVNITDNILDADIDDLLKYDSIYKSNSVYINDLLSSVNDYKLDYNYKYVHVDVSDIENQLATERVLYVESLDTFPLGDVKNVRWILNNDRYITSKYGYRVDPLNSSSIRFHAGTDYRAAVGTEVGSLFDGEVIDCGWSNTIGNYVTVQSGDNVKFLICHLSEILVKKGDRVKQYEPLALTGATGSRCTGPHLHLALYLNGVTYDVDKLFQEN